MNNDLLLRAILDIVPSDRPKLFTGDRIAIGRRGDVGSWRVHFEISLKANGIVKIMSFVGLPTTSASFNSADPELYNKLLSIINEGS